MTTTTTTGRRAARTETVVEYRGPANAYERQIEQLLLALRRREMLMGTKIIAMLVTGGMLSFVGPVILAAVISGVGDRAEWGLPIGSASLLALCAVVLVPWTYWHEWRTRGRFFEQNIAEHQDWLSGKPSSYGE